MKNYKLWPNTSEVTTIASGTGIEIDVMDEVTPVINNTGVISLAGTQDQINIDTATGNITLSLPNDIVIPSSISTGAVTANTLEIKNLSNSTSFIISNAQDSNFTYTLPNTLPTTNTDVLSSTVAGITSWVTPITSIEIDGSTGLNIAGSPLTENGTITLTLNNELQALATPITLGILARTANGAYAERTIGAGSSNINIISGNGVSGNPIIDLSSTPIVDGITIKDLPESSTSGVNKSYVDAIAAGMNFKNSCVAATIANLNAVYDNGTDGIGATLVNNDTLSVFTVDNISPSIGDRILVKNQTTTADNGIYILTQEGSGAVAWVLTRSTDYDQIAEIGPGRLVPVQRGTENAKTIWLEISTVNTIGTDPIIFTQFAYGPASFLQAANNLSDLTDVTIARDNLSLTNIAIQTVNADAIIIGGNDNTINSINLNNGQLLIGSDGASPIAATLTAGDSIGITNTGGAITIDNTGVTGLLGTANEITVSADTGDVTISLPDNVAISGSVTTAVSIATMLEIQNTDNKSNSFTTASDQSVNLTYTLPTTTPNTNLDVLRSTTTGIMSWYTPITSIGITGSTGLSISNSPLTTNGTIALTLGAELQALAGLSTIGLVTRTGANTYTQRAISAGSSSINIVNGDGIAGNPIIDLPVTGITAGIYSVPQITVNNRGIIIGITSGIISGLTTLDVASLNMSTNVLSTTTLNTNLILTANGTGEIYTGNNISIHSGKSLKIYNSSNTFYNSFTSGSISTNLSYTLPLVDALAPVSTTPNTQALSSNGSGVLSFSTFMTGQILKLPSGTNWVVPSGVTRIKVTAIGGGGAGGSCTTVSGSNGQGGGSGSVSIQCFNITPGTTSIPYVIGAGGVAAAAGANPGNDGSSTTFGSNATTGSTLIAIGGSGGRQGAITPNTSGNGSGLGGIVGTGTITIPGGNGSGPTSESTTSSGAGGSNMYGPGAIGAFAATGALSGNSPASGSLGGGGSGAFCPLQTSNQSGGSGSNGGIIIEW